MAYTDDLGNYSCPDLPREPDLPRKWDAGALLGAAGRRPRTGIAVAAAHTTLRHPDPAEASDAVKLSSCLGKFFRGGGEGDVLVVGPGLARGSAAPGLGEGLLLQVAQATTTHTGTNAHRRGCGPACRAHPSGSQCRNPDLSPGITSPGTTRGHRHQPHPPDPAALRMGIHRAMNDEGMNLAGRPRYLPRVLQARGQVAVACHVPIRGPRQLCQRPLHPSVDH